MGRISEDLKLQHFSKAGFIGLTEYLINSMDLRNIMFAQKIPAGSGHIEMHPEFFFDMPLSGKKHIIYGDGHNLIESVMTPGDCLFCRPLTWKHPLWDMPHEMTCFIYKEEFIRITYVDIEEEPSLGIYPKSTCFFHTQLPPSEPVKRLLLALSAISESGDPEGAAADIVRGLFRLTNEMLKDDHPQKFSQAETTFHRVQQYLHDNFHANINRKYVGYVFNLHPGYISRLYSQYSKKSFFETLYSLRMDHASLLLKNTEQKVENISGSCGYDSLPAFNQAFKKYYGLPPGRFRQLYRHSLPDIVS